MYAGVFCQGTNTAIFVACSYIIFSFSSFHSKPSTEMPTYKAALYYWTSYFIPVDLN